MKEMLTKMYMMVKGTLAREYGEAFTSMSAEDQAAACIKVLNDLIQTDARIAGQVSSKYLEEIAE